MAEQQVWRKSSYSGVNNNCVEVSDLPNATAVRDSKHPEAVVLVFPATEWTSFLQVLKEKNI